MTQFPIVSRSVRGVSTNQTACNDPVEQYCANCNKCTVGSMYCLEYLQDLVKEGYWDYLNLTRTEKTLDKYGWDEDDVQQVLLNMSARDFQKIQRDNTTTVARYRGRVDADQYETFWDGAYLSIKLALVDNGGELTGLVTFHTSGS